MNIAKEGGAAKELRYGGELIHRGKDGMVSLTDMWRAVGSPSNKPPSEWMRSAASAELKRVLEENMGISHVFRQRPGRTGGSWAHPLAAIAYAKFLSPEFHVWANKVILERLHQIGKARGKRWNRKDRSEQWIRYRAASVDVRHKFTDTLQAHGLTEAWEYGACTNEIYKPILGHDKNGALLERNLPAKANLRDHLDSVELAAVMMSEACAEGAIGGCGLHGASEIQKACRHSAESVKLTLDKNREFIESYHSKQKS